MSSIETIPVSSFMTRDVKTDKEDQNVIAACRIMHENNIGCIIIVNKDDKPVGIITCSRSFYLRYVQTYLEWQHSFPGDSVCFHGCHVSEADFL
jgi:predicted transcriptional regulator